MSELVYKGLDELKANMTAACNEYLDTAEKHLNRTGNKLKKIAKENTPSSPYEHSHKLKKSWKSEIKGYTAGELEYQLRNTAPHYHLVERGHVLKTQSGKAIGFVQGKHFLEKSVAEFESQNIAGTEFDKLAKDLAKRIEGGGR
ncbi:HK97 gp10 family phage protein [Megasphaera elsdenii]|uniref:HK97 gp10 family phage protein n=1 Tax=Megasphaera elsdenii TaxID=907 RepID=UPI003522E856